MVRTWVRLRDLGCTQHSAAAQAGDHTRQVVQIVLDGRCVGQGEHRWAQRAFLMALLEAVQVVCPDDHHAAQRHLIPPRVNAVIQHVVS